jgi:hypothetical protein
VESFLGDEFVGSDWKVPLKERKATSVKEVQKLSQQAKIAVGIAERPFSGRSRKRDRGGGS